MREAGGWLPAGRGRGGAVEAGRLPPLRRLEPARGEAAGARAGRGGWSPRGEGAAPSCMPPATRSTHCVGAPAATTAARGRARTPEEIAAATTAAQIGVVDDSFHGGGDEVRHDLLLLDARMAAD